MPDTRQLAARDAQGADIVNVRLTPWTRIPVNVDVLAPAHYNLAIGRIACGTWLVIDRPTALPVGLGTTRHRAIGDAFCRLKKTADARGTDTLSLLERLRAAELSPVGIGHA